MSGTPPSDAPAAARRLGADEQPVLLRLPFSHYCRKAEWGLTRAGVPYRTIDVGLRDMRHVRRANPVERTVPVLVAGTTIIHGSHPILRWADERRAAAAETLYPERQRKEVLAWEAWADRSIGAPVRREAYRVLASDPRPFGRTTIQKVRLWLARPLFRYVLRYIKGEEHVEEDPVVIRDAIARVVAKLRETDTGFLFADRPTAADTAVAALLEPILPIAKARGFDQVDGWGEFRQYVRTVRPTRTTRVGKRRIEEDDWVAFEVLNRADTKLERPTADQTAP